MIKDTPCKKSECTVLQTGICLLNNDVSVCPERINSFNEVNSEEVIRHINPVLDRPATKPRFPTTLTLSLNEAYKLMSSQYCRVIGILGNPDAGKTAALVSLYTLLAHSKLEGFEFRDSQSIMAFEEISQGARRWIDGHPPEQMTTHTELKDIRNAGFMHLRMLNKGTAKVYDLLLPDLPGEWTLDLLDINRTDRFEFIKSAECIWLMVDGSQLLDKTKRNASIHRTKLLIQRIAAFLGKNIPPIILVITRQDLGVPENMVITQIKEEAIKYNITMTVAHIASFAKDGDVVAGAGIAELISSVVNTDKSEKQPFWQDDEIDENERNMLRFRHTRISK